MLVRKEFIEEVRELGRVRCLNKLEFKDEFKVDPEQVGVKAEPVLKPGGNNQDMYKVWVGPKDAFEITHLSQRAYMQDTLVDNGRHNFLRSQQHSTFMRAQAHVQDKRASKSYKCLEDVHKEASALNGHAAAAAQQGVASGSAASVVAASTGALDSSHGHNSDDEKEFGNSVNKRQKLGVSPAKTGAISLEDTRVLHTSILCQISSWQLALPAAVLNDHGRALQRTAAGLRAEARFNEVTEVDEMSKELTHIRSLTQNFQKAFSSNPHKKVMKNFVSIMDKNKGFSQIVQNLGANWFVLI
jgi:hypothetical protein